MYFAFFGQTSGRFSKPFFSALASSALHAAFARAGTRRRTRPREAADVLVLLAAQPV